MMATGFDLAVSTLFSSVVSVSVSDTSSPVPHPSHPILFHPPNLRILSIFVQLIRDRLRSLFFIHMPQVARGIDNIADSGFEGFCF